MRNDTIGYRRSIGANAERPAWRSWAGSATAAVVDRDLATMLDRSDDGECGLRTPGAWRRRRW
jgi:hypothetical protein